MTAGLDQLYVYATAALIVGLVVSQIWRRSFDAFAPIWLFLAGYTQVYVVQALSYRDYAIGARGYDVVSQANLRALWALALYLGVYYSGLGRLVAGRLPSAPKAWSIGLVLILSPVLIVWGLTCAGLAVRIGHREHDQDYISPEQALLLSFPTVQLVAAVVLIVTGRQAARPRPFLTWLGVATALSYTAIWLYYGRRSHSLFGVLTCIAAYYVPRFRRPGLPVLGLTATVACLLVALALGWRNYKDRHADTSLSSFGRFVGEFDPSDVLVSLNLKEPAGFKGLATREALSRETEEYGGFLLMMATVPRLAGYDYGESYARIVSTYIPRLIWHDKPYFGRAKWIAAWMAGSEFERKPDFTGPAIGILGAGQLNGGAFGTFLVIACVALMHRAAYDYFRLYADRPWAQAWWALTYFNAWLAVVNDDPFVWFYYLYGHTILPPMALLWMSNKLARAPRA